MAITTALKKIEATLYEPTRYKVIQGGMSAGKTYAIMTLLVGYAMSYEEAKITVVGLSYGHLKDGAMSDFKAVMREGSIWDAMRWNISNSEYTFSNGSVIQFRSVDKMGARGPRRDVVFINEANGISYEVFRQLADRSRDFSIIDYNPSAEFWAHTELVKKKPEKTSFLILTHEDNEALSSQERDNILEHKPKDGEEPSNWWIVYGLGQIGSLEGNIYKGWELSSADSIAESGRLIRYGLDFGFSNDETALVAVYDMGEKKLGLVEKIYKKGILPSQYCAELERAKVEPSVLIVADGARPEIIAEIKRGGYRCIAADKGAGSVLRGIERVSEYQVEYDGKDLEREYLSYAWRKKKSGELQDEPIDAFNHALDAVRYAVDDLSRPRFDF